MALEAGAEPRGDWGGCHSIARDLAALPTGERGLTNLYSKQFYPIGVGVNAEGRRFLDEGADYRNYTDAKYGAEILRQPGGVAFQLFDAKTEPLLRQDEYSAPGVSRYEAQKIRELAGKMRVRPEAPEQTVARFNRAVQPGRFDPSVKDGKRTEGIESPKTNWALSLDTPPYCGFAVTGGITFTFGGVHVDGDGRVLNGSREPIAGLHAAGGLVGGLFYDNHPGGSELSSGAVFGRRAERAAAGRAGKLTEASSR
jgi:tricarballylate dehydrogenase